MRKILIVGNGQAGLQLALGLLRYGYDVTVMCARTAEEIRNGRVMSTQAMFDGALQDERNVGLNFWESAPPHIKGIGVSVGGSGSEPAIDWLGRFHDGKYAQSIDQRVKMAHWMETFENRGGKLVIHGVTVSDLDRFAKLYALVIIAAGKGELVSMFNRDASRSPYSTPQRALSVVYVHGVAPYPEHAVSINLVPGIGELFIIPGRTLSGPCNMLFFEGIPQGPLDCWADLETPEEHLARTLECIRTYVPWEYERVKLAELTDSQGTLKGRYPPTVRHPIGRLPSGGAVLGMADVVVANDPVTGQGSNNASKCANIYLQSILEHGNGPFDTEFMQRTFERFWEYAQHPTAFTNTMLQPPSLHALKLLQAAGRYQEIADRFAHGFDDPRDLSKWFLDPAGAETYLAEVEARNGG